MLVSQPAPAFNQPAKQRRHSGKRHAHSGFFFFLSQANSTIRMGEMEGWMDETFIKNVFQTVAGENVQVKVIRDRNSG